MINFNHFNLVSYRSLISNISTCLLLSNILTFFNYNFCHNLHLLFTQPLTCHTWYSRFYLKNSMFLILYQVCDDWKFLVDSNVWIIQIISLNEKENTNSSSRLLLIPSFLLCWVFLSIMLVQFIWIVYWIKFSANQKSSCSYDHEHFCVLKIN